MLGSGLSNQTGAAIAALAFPVIGPVGVVAVRQWVAAAVLGAVGRPRLRRFTAAQWWPVLGLALVFAAMNLSLYVAIERIGLGLAITLEFLGPLTVALVGLVVLGQHHDHLGWVAIAVIVAANTAVVSTARRA